jgi:hypothetical protein
MSDVKEKQRSAKRGGKPTTLAVPTPEKVSFVDPQPQDRYNLVFFAEYADVDAVLAATDEAYLKLYHDEFPAALQSKTVWTTKQPGSRSHCKADLIKEVGTLAEIAREIRDFIADHRDKPKKFGTILLAGHGNPEEFSLPLATSVKRGGRRLPLPHLEIGLRHVDVLNDKPPGEWKWGPKLWGELQQDLMRLKIETDSLQKWMGATWTDEQTLMRVWCCNLGKPPQAGGKDPLQVFGKMYFGSAKHMIEAPKNKSGSTWNFYPLSPSSPKRLQSKLFRDEKKKNGLWHPDGIAEVESSDALIRHTGEDLTDAQAEFVKLAFRGAPDPNRRRHDWIPTFYVEDDAKRAVFPQDWAKFSGLWRRVGP